MIAKPDSAEAWTLELVRELAASGVSENDWYDFKADIHGNTLRHRKAVAAFANTDGGFLVFGVTDDRVVSGLDRPELPRDFGNKLTDGLNPSVEYLFREPILVQRDRYIWVCHVPRSRRGPH